MTTDKILYMTDLHLREHRPENRVEVEFLQVQLDKLTEVSEIAVEEGVSHVLIGGDIFHCWRSSLYLTAKAIRAFRKFRQPICTCIGNHDVEGYNLGTLDSTSLGVIDAFSDMVMRGDGIYNVGSISVKCIHSRVLGDFNKEDYSKGKPTIVIAHELIVPETLPYDFIFYRELDGLAPVVLCAHYHKPFLIHTESTSFINPGALSRLKVDERWDPSVAILTFEDAKLTGVKMRRLGCSKSADDVFKVVTAVEQRVEIPKFDLDRVVGQSLVDKVIASGRERQESEPVVGEAVKRVAEAERLINT